MVRAVRWLGDESSLPGNYSGGYREDRELERYLADGEKERSRSKKKSETKPKTAKPKREVVPSQPVPIPKRITIGKPLV
jgi:hypothetical protein